jgi:Domain of unknown function DUF29
VCEEEYYRLESALRVLMPHLIKWGHQLERSRSWTIAAREERRRIGRQLRENLGLNSRFDQALRDAYEDARDEAASETNSPKTIDAR